MDIPAKKPRLEWLDALRGFTMILVVAYHVGGSGFAQTIKWSSSMPFLVMFRMPLFFFVSGFLAYRASQVWDLPNLWGLIRKKLRVQMVPTLVFFFLYVAMLANKPFWEMVMSNVHIATKGGYWFTLVLLYMFLLYYPFAYLESKLPRRSWVPITVFFVISMLFYESCYLPKYFYWAYGSRAPQEGWLWATSIIQLMRFMPFFLFGNIVHRYWEQAQRVMDSKWFYPLLIVVVICAALDYLKWHTLRMAWANLPQTVARFGLLTICFMYFRHYQQYFTKFSPIGASLQYIGRRTLDIYLLHFFFLPNLPNVGQFFDHYRHNFVMDVTLSVLVGLLVIAFSIIASNILRVSPFLKKWLFGRS